ncbi:MAG: CoA pyrophosphatase [Syntrophales bacterium]
MNTEILTRKDLFVDHIVRALGAAPIDFCERIDFIQEGNNTADKWKAAGVLLPLSIPEYGGNEIHLHLIKRSRDVAQGGDLSCPGGLLDLRIDPIFRLLLASRLLPVMRGEAFSLARERGSTGFKNITLFLANALREAWEEVGINPLQVRYLGPLPCRNLILFTRTIFPVAGFIRKNWRPRTNWEVEKVVAIPVRNLLENGNYALFRVEATDDFGVPVNSSLFPCFIHRDSDGTEEFLWGATYQIVMTFLKVAFDFDPRPNSDKILKKVLRPGYLTGEKNENAKLRR